MIPAALKTAIEPYHRQEDQHYSAPSAVDRETVDLEQIVTMVLVKDTLGRTQVIFPADCLFDIHTLSKQMGRELEPLKHEDVAKLLSSYNVAAIPAIPDITGLPAMVDSRVFAMPFDDIYLDAGDRNTLIKIDKGLFLATLNNTQQGAFTIPLATIPSNQCHQDEDAQCINQAVEKFTTRRIKQRIEDTLELPPLPKSAQAIIKLRADGEAGCDELSSIVEKDPSLSAQVVSWAASSLYNAPGKIKSVHDAIIRVLGFDLVMNLSIGLSLGASLKAPIDTAQNRPAYWHEALWTALSTTALIAKIEAPYRPNFGMAYLSGLLHNIGYLALAHIFPPHFKLICLYMDANPHVDPSVIEHHLLGITSEQVGSQLMTVWGLPAEVITAMRHQKNGRYQGANAEYAKLLTLSKYVLAKRGIIPMPTYTPVAEICAFFNINEAIALEAGDLLFEKKDDVDNMVKQLDDA
jgi:HD-like signal output (HDOD) protein/prolyl-tRNA editing enzyme YbaK/EbsC (Cys-tRNA(Pro) deacylase)